MRPNGTKLIRRSTNPSSHVCVEQKAHWFGGGLSPPTFGVYRKSGICAGLLELEVVGVVAGGLGALLAPPLQQRLTRISDLRLRLLASRRPLRQPVPEHRVRMPEPGLPAPVDS